jgi:hypothetical protein
MLEGKNNYVQIKDVDADVMQQILCFIYTGRASNIEKMADILLSASDKVCCNAFAKDFVSNEFYLHIFYF